MFNVVNIQQIITSIADALLTVHNLSHIYLYPILLKLDLYELYMNIGVLYW